MSGNVVIEAVAAELPPHRVTSTWIEEQFGGLLQKRRIPHGQIEALTGIKARRLWDPEVKPSDAATMAARKAIEKSGIDPQKIGVLINTSVCKDYIEPSVACLVHGNLKLSPHCINYDIGNACLGFINAMHSIKLMIKAGQVEYGMIVDGESSREILEATIDRLNAPEATLQTLWDNFATLTLGSGAAAMILTREDLSKNGGHVLNGGVSMAATEHCRLCLGQPTHMVTDAPKLMVNGVQLAHETWQLACKEIPNWSDATIDHYIPHQVSARNMQALNEKLGLTPEKHYLTFPEFGNIGPAAVPITLAAAEDAGILKPGNHIALMGIGSGLNCSMMSVTW